MRFLITGSDGFLGRKMFNSFKDKYETFGITRREGSSNNKIYLDITSPVLVDLALRQIRPDVVIHTAGLVDVKKSEEDKEKAYSVNSLGPLYLARACKNVGSRIVYVSSDYVFSGTAESYSIDTRPDPINYYGVTKVEGEKFVQETISEALIVRPTILYGFNADGEKNLVLDVVKRLSAGEEVALDNVRVKYPLLIDDLSKSIEHLVLTGAHGIHHISGTDEVTKYTWGQKMAKVFGFPQERVIGRDFNELDRPFKVKFAEKGITKLLNLEEGLELIRSQMESAGIHYGNH